MNVAVHLPQNSGDMCKYTGGVYILDFKIYILLTYNIHQAVINMMRVL